MRALYVGLLAFAIAPGATQDRKAPDAISYTKRILCDGKWKGHGVPTGPRTLVTVAHVIDGCVVSGWEDDLGNAGYFTVLRREYKEKDGVPVKDYALLISNTQFSFWAAIEKRTPRNGEILYSSVLLPGNHKLCTVSGPFIGVDGQGHYESDIMSHPGSSGTPVMNADGKLVAVTNGGYGQSYGHAMQWSTPVGAIFD